MIKQSLVAAVSVAAALGFAHSPTPARAQQGGFNLFSSTTLTLGANRVLCGIDSEGHVCINTFSSPTGGGGFWPTGSVNQYVYNSGIQVAGIFPQGTYAWAGDTAAVFFHDSRGTADRGEALSRIYDSLEPDDIATWPTAANIRNGALYNETFLGRRAISDQDSWVRYWDADTTTAFGRAHPMGVMVEQRTMAFNHPQANRDILYLVFDIYNITTDNPADYDVADAGVRQELAEIGSRFRQLAADVYNVDLPAEGIRFDSVYISYTIDGDIGNAGTNSSTAVLPFDLGFTYKSDFSERTWAYPPGINSPPFGPYPGFVATQFIRTPNDVSTGRPLGLTLFSNTEGGATAFPDPVGSSQLWRYLSANVTSAEGDRVCSIPNPKTSRMCFLVQVPIDTRYFQVTGPTSLDPGQKVTVVMAFVFAAPVAAPLEAGGFTGGIFLPPGVPASGAQIAADPNAADPTSTATLRPIEFSSGWINQTDRDGDGVIEMNEVNTVPRSLLQKAQVAKAFADGGFVGAEAPQPPPFYLIPGDGNVTVIWEKSPSEFTGDAYFAGAGDVGSPLYDPNYREFDVEGYRVYRGVEGSEMEWIFRWETRLSTRWRELCRKPFCPPGLFSITVRSSSSTA